MKTNDIDYLYISSRIKGLQKNMAGHDALIRLAAAKTHDDALKILTDCGFQSFDPTDLNALEKQIDLRRHEMFKLLYTYSPSEEIIDVFRLKYDYHNIKSILKANAVGVDALSMLMDSSVMPPDKMILIIRDKLYYMLSPTMGDAIIEASDLLTRTGDPQLSDILLDRAYFKEMQDMAEKSESEFLIGYVRLLTDLANLRIITRAKRAEKGLDYLKRAVIKGGSIGYDRLITEPTADFIKETFAASSLAYSAEMAAGALTGERTMAELDKACDNALMEYIKSARLVAFGEAHVVAYLIAFEAQLVAIRTVMMGRKVGLSEEKIAERLRESYV